MIRDSCKDRTALHRRCRPLSAYLRYVRAMDRRYGPVTHVYVATDDAAVVKELEALNEARRGPGKGGGGFSAAWLAMDRSIYAEARSIDNDASLNNQPGVMEDLYKDLPIEI